MPSVSACKLVCGRTHVFAGVHTFGAHTNGRTHAMSPCSRGPFAGRHAQEWRRWRWRRWNGGGGGGLPFSSHPRQSYWLPCSLLSEKYILIALKGGSHTHAHHQPSLAQSFRLWSGAIRLSTGLFSVFKLCLKFGSHGGVYLCLRCHPRHPCGRLLLSGSQRLGRRSMPCCFVLTSLGLRTTQKAASERTKRSTTQSTIRSAFDRGPSVETKQLNS